jgi:hypothetical protein
VLPTPTGQSIDSLQADLARARQATVGEIPLIQPSVDPDVTLPRGLLLNGSWHTRVTVRELTGVDEEALARVKSVLDMFDTVLGLGTTRIGDVDLTSMPLVERQGMLQQLLLGERDQLYIAIIRATYGNEKKLKFTCPSCDEEQDLFLFLAEDFKAREVADVARTEFTYTTRRGDVLSYRPAIGSDQIEALGKKGASPAEQNTVMLSRCIKTANGQMLVNPVEFARGMSMMDRQALLEELVERQPSVDMAITINCVACREDHTIPLGWGDIFRA